MRIVSVSSEEKATKGYSVVLQNGDGEDVSAYLDCFWLATPVFEIDRIVGPSGSCFWGMSNVVDNSKVLEHGLYLSNGRIDAQTLGVRPVVSLKSDIQLTLSTGNTECDYEISK